jgi:hypothetical protein
MECLNADSGTYRAHTACNPACFAALCRSLALLKLLLPACCLKHTCCSLADPRTEFRQLAATQSVPPALAMCRASSLVQ